MGFGQGLSGLKGAAQKLDVIGNNIANAGTVGFKSSTVSFADVYASSRVGLGTQVASVNQNFTVGTISNTGNQFDMAIDGGTGLFRVQDSNGNILYTRNGEFKADKSGNIVNAQGYKLTGYPLGSTAPTPIQVPSGNIAPQATTTITSQVNVDANVKPIAATFDADDPATYHHTLPLTVYDQLGNPHQVTQYFVKEDGAAAGEWKVHYQVDTRDTSNAPLGVSPDNATVTFNSKGLIESTDPAAISLTLELDDTTAPTDDLVMTVNYAGSTQFAGDFSYTFDQNGYPTGDYSSMSIGSDGSIMANYTNGEVKQMGFLVLANFNNLQGLQPVGGNAWRETSESGQPILGTPGTNGMALLKGQAVEESNVDMGTELVNMIITQRTYQANAQTISTQNEIMQTLINMR